MTNLNRLVEVIATLRSPQGCPWDRAQTLRSMRAYLVEETYEVLDAINLPDTDPDRGALLAEELGDLLFNVLMLTQIASDNGITTTEQVAAQISDKMVTRHPHVFDPENHPHADGGTLALWETIKNRKKKRTSRLDGIPHSLPALLRAYRQGEKAGLVGFDWHSAEGVFAKIDEELGELREAIATNDPKEIEHEYGDLLMATASLGRQIGANPEDALQVANNRFYSRFATMERLAKERGLNLNEEDDDSLDALWEEAKRRLR